MVYHSIYWYTRVKVAIFQPLVIKGFSFSGILHNRKYIIDALYVVDFPDVGIDTHLKAVRVRCASMLFQCLETPYRLCQTIHQPIDFAALKWNISYMSFNNFFREDV